jgi:hypothetical protein
MIYSSTPPSSPPTATSASPVPSGLGGLCGGLLVFTSAIVHADTAAFLSAALGIEVPARRVSVAMVPGDQALVLRLTERLPEGKLLTEAELAAIPYQLAWLERLA